MLVHLLSLGCPWVPSAPWVPTAPEKVPAGAKFNLGDLLILIKQKFSKNHTNKKRGGRAAPRKNE